MKGLLLSEIAPADVSIITQREKDKGPEKEMKWSGRGFIQVTTRCQCEYVEKFDLK